MCFRGNQPKGEAMSAQDEQAAKSANDANYPSTFRKRFSKQWLLGKQLTELDDWGLSKDKDQPTPTLYRLNWSINWHTKATLQAQRWYTVIKFIEISAAASIPVLTATGGDSLATKGWIAGLGALIVVLEGIQQLKKYAQNALLWGQGKEALKREYYLYKGQAAPYDAADDKANLKTLSFRVEQIIGQEVTKWAAQPDGKVDNEVHPTPPHPDMPSK
jgi:Protein of unknown function (DUF4231)